MGISTSDSLRDWLRAPGSLSRRLARLGERFEVQLLRQGVTPFRALERRALGLPPRGLTVVREVILRVDGRPCVWARSAVHQRATTGPWRALKGLGTRPLAHLLYDDPLISRSAHHTIRAFSSAGMSLRSTGCPAPSRLSNLPCRIACSMRCSARRWSALSFSNCFMRPSPHGPVTAVSVPWPG